ncbi:Mitochondrial antiviral-signaling protein [Varanus komodoensis]|nr:Mitochondrial antiviral-signaling protein [Varanus komodoensis]
MGFAEDQVKKYINSNLRKFHRIRVDQMLHLRCFTEMDRQQLRARVAREGNDVTVWDFFQHLQSREGWVTLLIDGLREDNLGDLAEDIQSVYDSYRSWLCFPLPIDLFQQTTVSSTTNAAADSMDDYQYPVQESSLAYRKSEIEIKPKVTDSARKTEPSNRCTPSAPKPRTAEAKPTDSQPASVASVPPETLPEDHLGEKAGAVPKPVASNSGTQRWDGRPQQPVCVENGYFGNAKRLAHNGVSLAGVAAPRPRVSSNQPEETYYVSSDSSPVVPSRPGEPQASASLQQEKSQAPRGYPGEDPLANAAGTGHTLHPPRRCDKGLEGRLSPQERSRQSALRDCNETPAADPAGSVPGTPRRRGLAAAPGNAKPLQEEPLPLSRPERTATAPQPAQVPDSWLPNAPGWRSRNPEENPSPVRRFATDGRVFYSSDDAQAPCKPGVLTSLPCGAGEELTAHLMSDRGPSPPYSGTSSRLLLSTFTFENNTFPASDLNQDGQPEELLPGPAVGPLSGREVSYRADDVSPPGCQQADSSIRSYGFHVEEKPSPDLTSTPPGLPLRHTHRSRSPDAFSDTATRLPPIRSLPSRPENSENPLPDKNDAAVSGPSSNRSLLLASFVLAAVAVVAFALYKKE